jgi:hypothetical protein
MQRNWTVWMRAVIVTAAALTILVSALLTPPEIDHHFLPTQAAVASAYDIGAADDGPLQLATETNCHIGHSCTLVIMPDDQLALTRFNGAPELRRTRQYNPSRAGDTPFHPPRILSQI